MTVFLLLKHYSKYYKSKRLHENTEKFAKTYCS